MESRNQTILKETHQVQPPLGVSDSRNNPAGSESGRSMLCGRASKETLMVGAAGAGEGREQCMCAGWGWGAGCRIEAGPLPGLGFYWSCSSAGSEQRRDLNSLILSVLSGTACSTWEGSECER